MNQKWSAETLAAQALGEVDAASGGITPAIQPSTSYERNADGSYRSGLAYTRSDNPTYDHAERLLTTLESGAGCMLFASGSAAATAVFQALLPGDHVLVSRVLYWGVRQWLAHFGVAWGLDVEFIDTTDLAAVRAAIRPGRTRLLWLETPANPLWDVTDIDGAVRIAHAADVRVAVDNTVATPVLTRPIALGVDLVVHSATKYLNGHGDVLAGAVVTARADPFWERIRVWRRTSGSVLGPFEAWLLQRGMRTLFLRVQRSSATALAVARHFEGHAALSAVLYPGLPSHPGHEIAARQMIGGFSGMLSIRVNDGERGAMTVAGGVTLFKRATSLGGVESLIEHRKSTEGASSPIPDDLLRLSIGLETADDLITDLEAALKPITSAGAARAPIEPRSVPSGLLDVVRDVVEQRVAPSIIARGGQLRVKSVADGVVTVEASGSPGAIVPAMEGIEPLLRAAVPGVAAVHVVWPADSGAAVPASDTAARIQQVLDEEVNPAVAAHGGHVVLLDATDGRVRIRLEGGCQGCSLAEVTVRQGVERLLRQRIAGLAAVVDVTDHQAGAAPYYAPGKR
jgi:cystathionine gamma-synthase